MRLTRDVLATDLYAVLGVPKNASEDQLRRAYRMQVMTSHPDLHGVAAEHRMVALNIAACVLLDPPLRAEYDRLRAEPKRVRSTPTPWYPWGVVASADPPRWEQPVPRRPEPTDSEARAAVRAWRGGAGRSFAAVAAWSDDCPPGTHLAITFVSACLALLLIASAHPRSLPGMVPVEPVACVPEPGPP